MGGTRDKDKVAVCLGRVFCATAVCAGGMVTEVTVVAARAVVLRIAPDTLSTLARVRLRTIVAVVAGGTVGRSRIRACTSGWIAGARQVALVLSTADHRIVPDTLPPLARVRPRTGIAVVAARVVWQGGPRRRAHRGLAGLALRGVDGATPVERAANVAARLAVLEAVRAAVHVTDEPGATLLILRALRLRPGGALAQ